MGITKTAEDGRKTGLIASRYRISGELGRGGMAVVYEAHDLVSGQQVALKRLEITADSESFKHAAQLFEAEFVTLSRLAHPRVVAVHDYGHDGTQPFYTQELLTGGDLHARCPLPWQEACRVLIDVCSALSLLHSRGQVHRDVTPRNIRCTADNRAKLIDFGALAPFGASKQIVGTAPFVCPEALGGQVLDGRSDLYALGATAYFALTGRHAYPIKRLSDLRDAWRTPPSPPSQTAANIPRALDELVLSLLQLQPMARPASAAEVIERLAAIAKVELEEQLLVRQAYLAAPNLCARDEPQLQVRKAVQRAQRRRGGSILVVGEPGTGRTRFLDTCVLEAKLAGMRVARADSGDAYAGPWGAGRALADQLLVAYPDEALDALGTDSALLAEVLPAVGKRLRKHGRPATSPPVFETPQARRAASLVAYQAWILALSRIRPLAVAVDDLADLDEVSGALFASLGHATKREPLLMIATGPRLNSRSITGALSLLAEASATLVLRNLSQEQTEALLTSIFGSPPNIRLLSARLFDVARGNPKATIALAQHLLRRDVIRYEAGAWDLPAKLESTELPSSVADLLITRVAQVPTSARSLAEAIALACADVLTFDECRALDLHKHDQHLLGDIATLVELGVLKSADGNYGIVEGTTRHALVGQVPDDRESDLHRRLSHLFETCRDDAIRTSMHAFHADDITRAMEWMMKYANHVYEQRGDHLAAFERVRALPPGSQQITRALYEVARRDRHPRLAIHLLQITLLSDGVLSGGSPIDVMEAVLQQLHHDCGLDLYEQYVDETDPARRLKAALQGAQARFDAADENERVLSPGDAIPRLAQVIVSAIGVAVRGYDYALLERTPRLGPLTVLATPLQLVDMNQQACMHVLAGRTRRARASYAEVLARMEAADDAGEDLSALLYMRLAVRYAMGLFDIHVGSAKPRRWAKLIEHNPSFAVNAHRLRMLSSQSQGDWRGAEQFRIQLELLRVQNCPPQIFEGSHLYSQLEACAAAEDLVRVKQLLAPLEAMAAELPTWNALVGLGRGAYNLLRGDAAAALADFSRGLVDVTAGQHVAWSLLASGRVKTLSALGRLDEAIHEGESALATAERLELESADHQIHQSLALAYALSEQYDKAVALADASVASLKELGATGITLGNACEVRARVAVLAGDDEEFAAYSSLCAEQFRAGRNPILTAKYERLMQFARQRNRDVSNDLAGAAGFDGITTSTELSAIGAMLSACSGTAERAQEALRAIVRSHGESGFLYIMQDDGPALYAQLGNAVPSADLDRQVKEYIAAEVDGDGDGDVTVTVQVEAVQQSTEEWAGGDGGPLVPILLSHDDNSSMIVTGLAVIQAKAGERIERDHALLNALSRALHHSGDAVTAVAI